MQTISRSRFLLLALGAMACRPEAMPVAPTASIVEAPTKEKKQPEPVCRTDDDCLRLGNSALTTNDTAKGLAALEYGCSTYPAGGSCTRLGSVYLSSPPADATRGREVLGYSCAEGAFDVCAKLAVMYHEGDGGEANEAKALSAASLGCSELGSPSFKSLRGEACFILGQSASPQERAAAKYYFSMSCALTYEPGCASLAAIKTAEEAEVAAKAAESAAKKAAEGPLPGANLNIGSLTSDGLALKDITCKVNGRIGLLGSLVVVAGLSERKSKLDACHKGSIETTVHFWQSGGKISKAEAQGADKKLNQ